MTATFMTGCTKLSDENNNTSTEMITSDESGGTSAYEPTEENNTSTEIDTPDVSDSLGVYVKLEREDVSTIALQGGNFTKVCEMQTARCLQLVNGFLRAMILQSFPKKKIALCFFQSLQRMWMTICLEKVHSTMM